MNKIEGKPFREYIYTQFPAVKGHIPLEKWMDEVEKITSMTLAEKCYRSDSAHDILFEKIHYILGGQDIKKCCEPGFIFKCSNCWTDGYDESVEIIVNEQITDEQADQILDLGFGQIYESVGDKGRSISRYNGKLNASPCSARGYEDEDLRLRVERKALAERVKELEVKSNNKLSEFYLRISQYLAVGGLFNPELMERDKVRTLLMDIRDWIIDVRS